jgi:predicted NBD/HSP70 family sugar kinase
MKSATKKDIAYDLNLSLPTVTNNLKKFIAKGLISDTDKVEIKNNGRKPVSYRYVSDAKVAAGVSSTKNHIRFALIDMDGTILKSAQEKQAFERNDKYLKTLGQMVHEFIKDANIGEDKLLGVGIGVTGLVDEVEGKVVYGKIVDNSGMTKREYSKYISYPTKLIHDAKAYSFCEMWMSSDMGTITDQPESFYINISNSIGGSLLQNNGVYRGDGLYSGEIGHMRLVPNGLTCYCGNKGCADPYCSVERLMEHTDGDLNQFFVEIKKGNKHLLKVWDEYLEYVSILINNTRMLFGGKIILGGYLRDYIYDYIDDLMEKIDLKNPFGEKSSDYLRLSNNMKPVETGVALYYIKEFLDKI